MSIRPVDVQATIGQITQGSAAQQHRVNQVGAAASSDAVKMKKDQQEGTAKVKKSEKSDKIQKLNEEEAKEKQKNKNKFAHKRDNKNKGKKNDELNESEEYDEEEDIVVKHIDYKI